MGMVVNGTGEEMTEPSRLVTHSRSPITAIDLRSGPTSTWAVISA